MVKRIYDTEIIKKMLPSNLTFTPKTEFYAFVVNDDILGFIGRQKIGKYYRIKSLYVKEEHRKQGIGEILLRYILSLDVDADYDCYATTMSQNLFARHGFIPQKQFKNKVLYMTKEVKK